MEVNLLLRLIVAHLLTDFILQPKSWVRDREARQGKSVKLYLHVTLTTLIAYLFSGLYDNWVIPVVIFVSHLLIDYLKSKTSKDNFSYFITDQVAHLTVIVVLWATLEHNLENLSNMGSLLFGSQKFWTITAGYIFVSWPLGIIIGKATQKWRDQIAAERQRTIKDSNGAPQTEDPVLATNARYEEQELGLASAGKWIGICERVLILTFVIMQQYTAIGFLMTAKSILRFSEKETNTQLKTEYILVGTLVSFASSAMIGVLMNIFIR